MSFKTAVKESKNDLAATMFVYSMDQHLRVKAEGKQSNRLSRGRFHVSSFLHDDFCAREVFYTVTESVKQATEMIPPRTRRIFLDGDVRHEKYQSMFQEMGIAKFIERSRYSESLDLTGTPDAIVLHMHRLKIIEIKSVNDRVFQTYRKPPAGAYRQAQMYLYLTGIPDALILTENKNNQEIKAFSIKFDPVIVRPIVGRVKFVRNCVDEKKIPERYCSSPNDFKAKRCPFRDICFKRDLKKEGEKLPEILKKIG